MEIGNQSGISDISELLGVGIFTVCDAVHKTCRVAALHFLVEYQQRNGLRVSLNNLSFLGIFLGIVGAIDCSNTYTHP